MSPTTCELVASESLYNQFPLDVTAELVHLEQLTVEEGGKIVDVDLTGLARRKGEGHG